LSRILSGSDPAWWHRRYVRQAEWTKPLRYHLYRRLEIARCQSILEIGCGTGVIANELAERANGTIYGLDIDLSAMSFLKNGRERLKVYLTAGDACKLPLRDESFDLIVTHYLWLWLKRPEAGLGECLRVLKKGGRLAAMAEPDYSKRQDFPGGQPNIGEFLSSDLKKKGADPDIGGKLIELFSVNGFKVETGSVNDKVTFLENPEMFGQEWELLEKLGYPTDELAKIQKYNEEKWMIMPVHWAIGRRQ